MIKPFAFFGRSMGSPPSDVRRRDHRPKAIRSDEPRLIPFLAYFDGGR